MNVKCIDATFCNLTENKIYKVITESEFHYTIINDKGDTIDYPKHRFTNRVEETPHKLLKGWELIKMVDEGKLKDGQIIYTYYKGIKQTGVDFKYADGHFEYIENILEQLEPYISTLLGCYQFSLKEKEYLTFDEARKSGKKFKHRDWNEFLNFNQVFEKLSHKYINTVNDMLDEKAWEVNK